ncbi:hypothetical protein BLOT_004606 [Blomia tropicalis]|nr:hypothetical protein BLOT_004606 [Blomia tropicalis]
MSQLINVITNRRPIKSKQISIKLNFQFKSNQKLNEFYNNIERFHQPNIIDSTGFIYGFHCPRSIL